MRPQTRRILEFAFGRFDEDRASYHISARIQAVPRPDDLATKRLPVLIVMRGAEIGQQRANGGFGRAADPDACGDDGIGVKRLRQLLDGDFDPAADDRLGRRRHVLGRNLGGSGTGCDILRNLKIGVAHYVHMLEETLIRAASGLGVEARQEKGIIGVYAAKGKLGSIGVRVTGGVSFHGFAFNVDPDLDHFDLIVPCGIPGQPVSSIARELGEAPPMARAMEKVGEAFGRVFEVEMIPMRERSIRNEFLY